MARLGVPLHVIELILNHQPREISGVAAIYNRHGFDREKCQALEAWADHVTASPTHLVRLLACRTGLSATRNGRPAGGAGLGGA